MQVYNFNKYRTLFLSIEKKMSKAKQQYWSVLLLRFMTTPYDLHGFTNKLLVYTERQKKLITSSERRDAH